MRHLLSIVLGSSLLALPVTAAAHIELLSPPPRPTESVGSPCGFGGGTRGDDPTVLVGGQELTVEWWETINHSGNYRIVLLLDGDDFPPGDAICDPDEESWCIADDISDNFPSTDYEYTFTVPNVDCDNCTLQVIQRDVDTGIVYYQCADLVIVAQDDAPPGGMGGAGPDGNGSGGTTGSGGTGGGNSGSGDPPTPSSGGSDTTESETEEPASQEQGGSGGGKSGCSLAAAPAGTFGGALLLPLAWGLRRRLAKRARRTAS